MLRGIGLRMAKIPRFWLWVKKWLCQILTIILDDFLKRSLKVRISFASKDVWTFFFYAPFKPKIWVFLRKLSLTFMLISKEALVKSCLVNNENDKNFIIFLIFYWFIYFIPGCENVKFLNSRHHTQHCEGYGINFCFQMALMGPPLRFSEHGDSFWGLLSLSFHRNFNIYAAWSGF